MTFEAARAIADSVLFEGYSLYPYRASSKKNQFRFTFGVLAPQAWSTAGGCEPFWMESACLVRSFGRVALEAKLRFLHIERRTVEEAVGGEEGFRAAPILEDDGHLLVSWDEAAVREIDWKAFAAQDAEQEALVRFEVPGVTIAEEVRAGRGGVRGRVIRRRLALQGSIRTWFERAAGADLVRIRVRVENVTPWTDPAAPRDAVLPACCAASHLLLSISDGEFVSLLDPPADARAAASECKNVGTYPVLVGPPDRRDLVLSSPIILYDHPRLAPESPGDFFDATEIDELLALRTLTLTDEEKAEARATDARAAAIIDRVERLGPEAKERLHGAVRDIEGAEMTPRAASAPPSPESTRLGPGCRVRLRPGKRRTDAQDMLFAGCIATVEKVMTDVDGRRVLAVTLDDDPAADLHRSYGRFHYYYLDEVEALLPAGCSE